jgi:hypothetical protein
MINKKGLAVSQCLLMVLGMVSFAFIVGVGSMERVSGDVGKSSYYLKSDGTITFALPGSAGLDEAILIPDSEYNEISSYAISLRKAYYERLMEPRTSLSCLTSQTQISIPYLSDGTYITDEMLEELNEALERDEGK